MKKQFENDYPKLNNEQVIVFKQIMDSVEKGTGQCFFVEGAGGTGKTFLWKVITAKLRSEGKIVLCVASSGIAALLMPGGRTAHSRFHIPIKLTETSTCDIYHGTDVAKLIQHTSLIIWDEAPMAHKFCIEALDRNNNPNSPQQPYGGMTVIFGGDFRQILPVIKRGSRSEIVSASMKMSYLWPYLTHLRLLQNMRLYQSTTSTTEQHEIATFGSWITAIGDGAYPDILSNYHNPTYLASRAVLAPHHEMVHKINKYLLSQMPSEESTYLSSDYVENANGKLHSMDHDLPVEMLNTLQVAGFPDHEIKLKVGVPIILLRNIDQSAGLCNGTRMIVKVLGQWFIAAEIIAGTNIGESFFLPRMTLTTDYPSLDITLSRRQYPIALCFAMTINKSQGQSLEQVGLCLQQQVFSHGQLYVALSRVTRKTGLKILSCDQNGKATETMQNIVFKEIFF
ncbi:ATP-dependent DNA helicase PIF1 [Linum perenne]